MPEYELMNDAGELQTVILTEEHENNTTYMIRVGDYNYTLQDIYDPIGIVLDANYHPVYIIEWENEIIRSTEGMLEPDEDPDNYDEADEPSWDDEPAPVPGHYGPEPDNLPDPATLFQPEIVDQTLHEQLTHYDPTTDIGQAEFYGQVYEIREVYTSTTPFIYQVGVGYVGCIINDSPFFY